MFVSFLKVCIINLTVMSKLGDIKELRKGKTKLKNRWKSSFCMHLIPSNLEPENYVTGN